MRGGPEWDAGPAAPDRMREWRLATVDGPAGDRHIAEPGPLDASQRTVDSDATQRRALWPAGGGKRGGSSPSVSGLDATVYPSGTRPQVQRSVRRAGRRPARWEPGPAAAMTAQVVEPGRASPDPLPSPVPRANPA